MAKVKEREIEQLALKTIGEYNLTNKHQVSEVYSPIAQLTLYQTD